MSKSHTARKIQEIQDGQNRVDEPETFEGKILARYPLVVGEVYNIFIKIVYLAIAVSFLTMGLCHQMVDFQAVQDACDEIEHGYTGVFAFEMLVKLGLFRSAYFSNWMNCLDFLLAWSSILDAWILSDRTVNLVVLRIFRIARLLRAVKILRMKRELFVLAKGIFGSLKALLWIMVLLGVVMYCVAIFLQDLIATVGRPEFVDADKVKQVYNISERYFPDLANSMLSLFAICIGALWPEVMDPVWIVQPYLVPVFIGFFMLSSFGLLNVIIGVITENTAAASKKQEKEDRDLVKKKQMQQVAQLAMLWHEMDTDGDKEISFQELRDHPHVLQMLRGMNIPPGFSLNELFMMLDTDGSQRIDPTEFIEGMRRCIECDDYQKTVMQEVAIGRVLVRLGLLEQRLLEKMDRLEFSAEARLDAACLGSARTSMAAPGRPDVTTDAHAVNAWFRCSDHFRAASEPPPQAQDYEAEMTL